MSLNCDARISPHSRTCTAGTTRTKTPPPLSQRYVCARNTRSVRSLRVAPKVQSYGGYISDAAYVYDTGPVFTGIRCTCIGEDRILVGANHSGRCLLAIIDAIQDATDLVARALRTGRIFQHLREARTRQSGRKRRQGFQHCIAITPRRVGAFHGAQLAEQ